MRKYFLLSAVAILAATNVNATTDYAEITAEATVSVAKVLQCASYTLNMGTFTIKEGNNPIDIMAMDTSSPYYDSSDIINFDIPETSYISCYDVDFSSDYATFPNRIDLTGTTHKQTIQAYLYASGSEVRGMPIFPADVKADTYTGSFTITYTY